MTLKHNNFSIHRLFMSLAIVVMFFLAGCTGDTMKQVTIETSMGNIVVELDSANAPVTVNNFLKYVDSGHYDGTIFHRVIPGFMIQGGGFTATSEKKDTLQPIKLEHPFGNKRGTIAMARTNDPNSATSQFFINLADNNFLDKNPKSDGYAVFGKVISGMDVVDKIAKVQTGDREMNQNWPVDDVVIRKISRR